MIIEQLMTFVRGYCLVMKSLGTYLTVDEQLRDMCKLNDEKKCEFRITSYKYTGYMQLSNISENEQRWSK